MYTLVFLTRYLDLGMRFVSVYNTILKSSTSYRHSMSSCSCAGSIPAHPRDKWLGGQPVLWAFSIALESVCVVPQLILLWQTTVPTVITSRYLLALGSYRALYILNWIWRYVFESVVDPIAVLCSLVQTAFYLDFAWVYYSRQRGKLRDSVLVDSEDFERGWLVRWLGNE
ncbi:ER lumen protein retaining receptor-domain-containing protein [Mycena rosella]|uniref:ER lumen protein retaining receptor-domain-containing protein n=1 Tax=Mycena rosella TaxID=1033263 RepID=A0AAD7DJJ7_MYCRO|nr:ER lumen protein retaining receptor-domain-containing protein [Mycena rosella]